MDRGASEGAATNHPASCALDYTRKSLASSRLAIDTLTI